MFSIIMTWIGAMLGIVVLLAMAFGAFVLDFDDALGRRSRRAARPAENEEPDQKTAPLV
ncbi:hypothetical protein SAMN05216266_101816 [Amycolatopsis marina]|uniref:Uncharacterized protein n=1 Tax=Amycolatopsis marina TaxID=490629 RepID=A0A1I0W9L6_9PSEU|nr:hypothetical protein [Amycolatopsis marina]SFA84713.1 hypothetical protein SAMN05216266_101816 [Amycolatopsis marina]